MKDLEYFYSPLKSLSISTVDNKEKIIQEYIQMQAEKYTGQAELEFKEHQTCVSVDVYKRVKGGKIIVVLIM